MNLPTKPECRAQMRAVLRSLDDADRAAASAAIRERLTALTAWSRARVVLLYVPRPDEPDVLPLLGAVLAGGQRLALPAYDEVADGYGAREVLDLSRDLHPGRFRIPEPRPDCRLVDLATLDLAVVPGLAFTRRGGRLGRGGGFYDRLLAATVAVRCGVAFREQLLPELPSEPHDARLDYVLTPDATHVVDG